LVYRFEKYVLDTDRRELRQGGDLVPLAPRVFDIFVYLIRHRERVVSKDDLMAAVWGGRIVSESALATRLKGARKANGVTGRNRASKAKADRKPERLRLLPARHGRLARLD
jgi:DNA-binding winged helix-turn-helix (wHTH) protein